MAARADPVVGAHWPRRREGAEGQVDPEAGGLRQFVQERDQEAARAGAEIDDAQGRLPVGKEVEGGLDEGLGVGPRHQGLGREAKGQAPELPLADDPRHRLMGEAAAGEGGEGRRLLLGGQGRVRMR